MRKQLAIEKKFVDYESEAYQEFTKAGVPLQPQQRFEVKQAFLMGAATMLHQMVSIESQGEMNTFINEHAAFFKDLKNFLKPPGDLKEGTYKAL